MTITVSCPSCDTSFPVDPAKVPLEGVRAQCSVCPEIFDVDRPNGATAEALPASEPMVDGFETADPADAGTVELPGIEGAFETSVAWFVGNGYVESLPWLENRKVTQML